VFWAQSTRIGGVTDFGIVQIINAPSAVLLAPTDEDFPFSRPTYQRDRTIMKVFQGAIAIAMIAVLAGCEPAELRPIPVGLPVGGGAAPVIPAQPAPVAPAPSAPRPIASPLAPVPINTDFEGRDYVWASDNLEAVRKCNAVVEFYRRRGKRLKLKSVENVAGRRWRCIFEEEVAE
jgi:hypothetical protein